MLTSADSSIPKTTGKQRRPAVPWWDKKCGTLRKITRRCYKKCKSKVILSASHGKTTSIFSKGKTKFMALLY